MHIIDKLKSIIKWQFILIIFGVIFVFGATLNFKVIESNGKMPVLSDYNYSDDEYFTYQDKEEVIAWYLTDWIYVPIANYFISIGDILLIIGCIGFFGTCIKLNWIWTRK